MGVGVGAKNWRVIEELYRSVALDWVMFANSLTVMHHPPELLEFIGELSAEGVGIVNSAVFHGGFLTGGEFYDYRPVDPKRADDAPLFDYRNRFTTLCERFGIAPAVACVQFGLRVPGVGSVALNTSRPERVQDNVAMGHAVIPIEFWEAMKKEGLLETEI
jgi:D-threo-aldose 1-dehydrogenase